MCGNTPARRHKWHIFMLPFTYVVGLWEFFRCPSGGE